VGSLSTGDDVTRDLEDSRCRYRSEAFIGAGAFCWSGAVEGDSNGGDSNVLKLERGHGEDDVGSSDVKRKGGRGGAGDSDVCR